MKQFFENENIMYVFLGILCLLLLLLILLIVKMTGKMISQRRQKKQEKKDIESIHFMDSLLKPATIDTIYIQNTIKQIIKNYLIIEYNSGIQITEQYANQFTEELYKQLQQQQKRYVEIQYFQKIIRLELDDNIRIKQDNSSVYTVSRLNVIARYYIEYEMSHPTFHEIRKENVEGTFVFVGTNDKGWQLDEIKKQILN